MNIFEHATKYGARIMLTDAWIKPRAESFEFPHIVGAQQVYDWSCQDKNEQVFTQEDLGVITPPWDNFMVQWVAKIGEKLHDVGVHVIKQPEGRNIVCVIYIHDMGELWTSPIIYEIAISEDGTAEGADHMLHPDMEELADEVANAHPKHLRVVKEMSEEAVGMVGICLMMMNMKGVVIEREQPTKRDIKKAKKKNRPLVQKSVVVLDPESPRYRYHSETRYTGEMPVHTVRGTWAEYTEEAPLFGKYVGKFWRPPHRRGNRKSGIVIKEHEIDI